MHDVAEFLKAHEPFTGLDDTDLEQLAERAKVEFFTAGTVIFKQDEPPPEQIRVIRRGSVDLVDDGRVLDELEAGEMFGQAWMFSGLPTGWEAKAHEDTLCYALAADDVVPLLEGPRGLRFVARALLMLPQPEGGEGSEVDEIGRLAQPAEGLMSEAPVVCEPGDSVREVARRMVEAGTSCALAHLPDGGLGILTDHDLRTRVVAEGRSLDDPVGEVLTTPVVSVHADVPAGELMLKMLGSGVRHLPVLSPTDRVLGVVTDRDLLAARARTPFVLRRAIADAESTEELREAAGHLNATVVALHRGGMAPSQISGIISVVVDSLIGRTLELLVEAAGPPPAQFAWLSLGSHGRREAVPSSDVDSGIVWADEGGEPAATYVHDVAAQVGALCAEAGLRSDPHGVTAAGTVMAWPAEEWRAAIGRWLDEPTNEKMMAISILLDARTTYGPSQAFGVLAAVRTGRHHKGIVRLLLRLALTSKPPTGFLHDIVVEHSGEHRGSFDIKHGGLMPIVGIARYAGLVAGAGSTSTVSRLRAAGAASVLPEADAKTLEEAFHLMMGLRLEHQVRQLEAGEEPDDHVDPRTLNPLTRRYLREAFRLVASTQKGLAVKLDWDR